MMIQSPSRNPPSEHMSLLGDVKDLNHNKRQRFPSEAQSVQGVIFLENFPPPLPSFPLFSALSLLSCLCLSLLFFLLAILQPLLAILSFFLQSPSAGITAVHQHTWVRLHLPPTKCWDRLGDCVDSLWPVYTRPLQVIAVSIERLSVCPQCSVCAWKWCLLSHAECRVCCVSITSWLQDVTNILGSSEKEDGKAPPNSANCF